MMIDKRFKVHSMIQGAKIGETIDLELCEELIKKYGSLSDIHMLIEDNGNDMTYQEVVDLLNENEELKQENEKFQGKYDYLLWLYNGLGCDYDGLKDENKELHKVIEENEKMIQSIYEELTKLRHIKENLRKIKNQWNWLIGSIDYD